MSLGSPIKLHRQAASASIIKPRTSPSSMFCQSYQPVPQSPRTLYGSISDRCLAPAPAYSAPTVSDGYAPSRYLPTNPFNTPPAGARTSSRHSQLLENQMSSAQHGSRRRRDSALRSTLSDKGEKAIEKGARRLTAPYVRPQALPTQQYFTPQSGPLRSNPSTGVRGAHRVYILPNSHSQRRGAIISKQLRDQHRTGMRLLGSPRRASISGLTHQLASSLHLRQYVQQQAQLQYPIEDPPLRSPSSESAYSDAGSLFSERSGISCNTTNSVHQQGAFVGGQRKPSVTPEHNAQQPGSSSYRVFIAPTPTAHASAGHPGAAASSSTRDGQQRSHPYSLPISRFYTRRGAILPHDGTASPTVAARELGIRLQQVQTEQEPASGPVRKSTGRMSATASRYGAKLTIPEPVVPLSPLRRSPSQLTGTSIVHPCIVLPTLSDRRSSLPLPRLTTTSSLSHALAPISPVKIAATSDMRMEDLCGEENQEDVDGVDSELDFCCRGGPDDMDAAIGSDGSHCGSGKPCADKMLLQGSGRVPSIMVPASELSKRRGKLVRSLNLR